MATNRSMENRRSELESVAWRHFKAGHIVTNFVTQPDGSSVIVCERCGAKGHADPLAMRGMSPTGTIFLGTCEEVMNDPVLLALVQGKAVGVFNAA